MSIGNKIKQCVRNELININKLDPKDPYLIPPTAIGWIGSFLIERILQDIPELSNIPHTEDGEPIFPGTKLYYFCPYLNKVTNLTVSYIKKNDWESYCKPYFLTNKESPVFSTPELAKQHKVKQLQQKIDELNENAQSNK